MQIRHLSEKNSYKKCKNIFTERRKDYEKIVTGSKEMFHVAHGHKTVTQKANAHNACDTLVNDYPQDTMRQYLPKPGGIQGCSSSAGSCDGPGDSSCQSNQNTKPPTWLHHLEINRLVLPKSSDCERGVLIT